ncbi:MAG: hypothetical protein IT342_04715 [Candidatus Melainabacteria bacterium]|jgi:hypothetical protein|nr:hypothetical protein [Candidatus Melainabacteria bacterium]
MAQVSARQYDAHYRRLGLAPGASVEAVKSALESLQVKLDPDRLTKGPLKDMAPFRLREMAESARLITDYWQLHDEAPPSIQGRHLVQLAAQNAAAENDEIEIRKAELVEGKELLGPAEPKLNFSYLLFKHVDGAVSPHTDVLKPRSIIGLLILGLIWVCVPPLIVKLLSFFLHDVGIERWLEYFSVLAQILPICFAPPLVLYEYAFFRQLQFPFAGTLRLPFDEAIDKSVSRLTAAAMGEKSAAWTVDSQRIEIDEDGRRRCQIKASYTGLPSETRLPLKMHMYIEPLGANSSLLVYWFELDWQVLFKGRAVSRIKSARFELDSLIKEN